MKKIEKEEIFNKYKNLSYNISNSYGKRFDYIKEDIEQVALMELWKCIDRYEENKGAFTTYATKCISVKIREFIVGENGISKRANTMLFKTMLYIMKNKDKTCDKVLSELKDIDWYKLTDYEFYTIYNNCMSNNHSLDSTVNEDGEFVEFDLEDENSSVEKDVDDSMFLNSIMDKLAEELSYKNSDRNVDVYMDWLESEVNGNPVILEDIGEAYDITKQRARQIINTMNERAKNILTKLIS